MKIVDLSKTIEDKMEVYEGDPSVEVELVHTYESHGWNLRKLSLGSHTGTHVDGFSHMDENGKNIDELPLDRFFGRAKLVSLDEEWPSEIGLFFSEEIGGAYFQKLLEKNPSFVGGNISEDLERQLLRAGIITYTDLVNLEDLEGIDSFIFYGVPLKIKEGDGSPVRAFAIID